MSTPASDSEVSDSSENVYCIFLHIVEGIGLNPKEGIAEFGERHKDTIIMNASLNGVKFEVEGHSTEAATIFNSNCIWECELGDIKRMKTDNRPVKIECFLKSGHNENSPRKTIGSLLLPIRGILTVTTLKNIQLKLHWHKLGAVHAGWRQNKPEIYLLLIIVKKGLIENGQFEAFLGKKKYPPIDVLSPITSETSLMLQSQSNIYVQLLEQVGLIQVGNNPDVDCDIFSVTLTLKQVKHLEKLLELERNSKRQTNVFVFHYDFLGSSSQSEIFVNVSDCYSINEKISISFKSSLKSLRLYFQRIFYVPITLYLNGQAIANYRFDFSKFLPEDMYFNLHNLWTKNGSFYFDRLHKILSPQAIRPSVDFIFSVQLLTSYAKKNNYELLTLNETFSSYPHNNMDERQGSGDIVECFRNMDFQTPLIQLHKRISYENCTHNLNSCENFEKNYVKADAATLERISEQDVVKTKSSYEFVKESSTEKDEFIKKHASSAGISTLRLPVKQFNDIAVGTCSEENHTKLFKNICIGTDNRENYNNEEHQDAVNVESLETSAPNTDELTLNIVRELEDWKSQQMEHFLNELERKETAYLTNLDKQWEQQRILLQARLEAKLAKCEELNAKLEKAHAELNANAEKNRENKNIAETVKTDIERSYAQKFQALDMQMQRLKVEMQQKDNIFEIRNKDVKIENTKLEREKADLKERIDQLEKQLKVMQETHLSADQLKNMLADLRIQSERFSEVEKSKNYYKDQWAKTMREVNKLKLKVLKEQEKHLRNNENSVNIDISLEEILNEEQDALNSDRNELKSIQQMLCSISSNSIECELDD